MNGIFPNSVYNRLSYSELDYIRTNENTNKCLKKDASKFNTIASVNYNQAHQNNTLVTRFKNQNFEFDANSCQASDLLNESFASSVNSGSHIRKGAPLYIICEKSQVKVDIG